MLRSTGLPHTPDQRFSAFGHLPIATQSSHNKHAESAFPRQLTDSGMDCLKADATSGVRQRQSARRKRETQFVGLFQPTQGKRSVKLSITQKLLTPLIEQLRKAATAAGYAKPKCYRIAPSGALS